MANLEACILRLRNLGFPARMLGNTSEDDPLHGTMSSFLGDRLVVRCRGFTVAFSEPLGITIEPVMPVGPGLIDYLNCHYSIQYNFENKSFFFELDDDAFVDCVVRHVQEASEVVAALPSRLRPC